MLSGVRHQPFVLVQTVSEALQVIVKGRLGAAKECACWNHEMTIRKAMLELQ